ncbi:MAG: XRE family transcriptional regulator, partial [Candidatus Polarisedimenticolia bacterium]
MVEQDAAKLNVGPRIRALRERCALTLSAVRERTGIGVSSLSELETGKRDPTVVQLKSLAECFHASIADLLSDAEVEPMAVRWRERPADGAAAMEARFEQLCRQYCQLERWADEELSVQLPCAPVYPRTAGEVEALARRVRAQLNLGDRPGLALRTALEDDCGVKLFHARFDPAGKAACAWHPEYGPAILLDARDCAARRTFDLAHELFHLLTWGVQRARP